MNHSLRLAPTPSGFLHIGNGINFVLTYLYAKKYSGILHLRIDDYDTQRVRLKYIDNIFESLEFLGITWDKGAKNTSDYLANFCFEKRKEIYFEYLQKIINKSYACECSRKDILKLSQNGIYPQTCKRKNLAFTPYKTALRVRVNDENLAKNVGDFIIWRKDNLPSYNFASLIDDKILNTSIIIRGEDLLFPTKSQLYLAKILNFQTFLNAKFIHHRLILSNDGTKLSKSTNSPSLLNENAKQIIFKTVADILNLPSGAEDSLYTLKEAYLKNDSD